MGIEASVKVIWRFVSASPAVTIFCLLRQNAKAFGATAPPVGCSLLDFLGRFHHFLLQRPSGTRDPTAGNFSRLVGPLRKPVPKPAACYCGILWSGFSHMLRGDEGGAFSGGDVSVFMQFAQKYTHTEHSLTSDLSPGARGGGQPGPDRGGRV